MANYKHGMCNTPEYRSWAGMLQRCYNPNNEKYENYGGRGIEVCLRWLDGFENFYEDMGPRPKGTSLDRENNDGEYSPENCKWSTPKEQSNNRRARRDKKARANNNTGILHVSKRKSGLYDVRVGKFFRATTMDFDLACRMAKEARVKYYGDEFAC